MRRQEYKHGLLLGGTTAIALMVIILAFQLTRAPIAKTTQAQLEKNLVQLLVPESYDNNPATDVIYISDPTLGGDEPQPVYRARLQGKPTGAVIKTTTQEGYNGQIDLLLGLSYEGDIVAVRVIGHKETPGLGDDIDEWRSDWIHSFAGLQPSNMQDNQWGVKKDGGDFDQFTGATITPRAVINAVRHVSHWYLANRDTLFAKTMITNATDKPVATE